MCFFTFPSYVHGGEDNKILSTRLFITEVLKEIDMIDTENKGARLLDMYERLSHGEVISKKELAGI